MGYYKCVNSTENKLIEGTYQEALSNCSALEDFNHLDTENVEFMRRSYNQKMSEPNGLYTGPVRYWTEIQRIVLTQNLSGSKRSFVLYQKYFQNLSRYNQTHFYNRSGIFNTESLKLKDEVIFGASVISNTKGKLRNNDNPSNCFCRKVTESSWTRILFLIGLTSSLLLLTVLSICACFHRKQRNNVP